MTVKVEASRVGARVYGKFDGCWVPHEQLDNVAVALIHAIPPSADDMLVQYGVRELCGTNPEDLIEMGIRLIRSARR